MTEWEELCSIISHHSKGEPSCEKVLRRLFHKALAFHRIDERPDLKQSGLTVRREHRQRVALGSLLTEGHRTEDEPQMEDRAIVVVVWRGKELLIDGRRRINRWLRTGAAGEHPVLVVTIQ